MSDRDDTEIRRDVVEEAADRLERLEASDLWLAATDEEAATARLALGLLRGELEGDHPPAVRAASEVLD